jgi:hypothetical protein
LPSASNRRPAWKTINSGLLTTSESVHRRFWRSASWARTAPNAPGAAPVTATGFRFSGDVATGRDTQSTAFFSTPGTP